MYRCQISYSGIYYVTIYLGKCNIDVASKWFRVCIYKLTKLLSYCAYKAARYTNILLYQAVMCLWWYTIFTSLKCVSLFFFTEIDCNSYTRQKSTPSTARLTFDDVFLLSFSAYFAMVNSWSKLKLPVHWEHEPHGFARTDLRLLSRL